MKNSLAGALTTLGLLSALAVVGVSSASARQFCISPSTGALYTSVNGGTCKGGNAVNLATASQVNNLASRISALEATDAAQQAKIAALQTANSALNARITTLEAANTELQSRFAGVSRSGDTLRFNHMNVQITNGEGSTLTTNGLGNLLIGYDENPGAKTGSHNLLLGRDNAFTSYAGIVVGSRNTISGRYATVTGGAGNTASGLLSSVVGGTFNVASGIASSVSGGNQNKASGDFSSVSGGYNNTASGYGSSILGGNSTTVSTAYGTFPPTP